MVTRRKVADEFMLPYFLSTSPLLKSFSVFIKGNTTIAAWAGKSRRELHTLALPATARNVHAVVSVI